MFAKNTLASAVAAAIGVSAVGVAQADTVFFPYAALSPTVTTVVSVINTSRDNWDQAGNYATGANSHLHYRFYYKSVADGENLLASCQEYNEFLPTSYNDIQTIDLGGVFGSDTAGVLFNDPSINNRWQQSGRDYAFGRYIQPARGYLTIDNSDGVNNYDPNDWDGIDGINDGETLAGEAFVFEFVSGAAWGYQAHSSDNEDFRGAASQSPSNVALMPISQMNTAFFVTPVSINQHPDVQNDYRARIELVSSLDPLRQRGDLYDRDENLVSGTLTADVVCVGRVNLASMLSAGTANRLADGGWGRLWNYRLANVGGQWKPAAFIKNNGSAAVFNVNASGDLRGPIDAANLMADVDSKVVPNALAGDRNNTSDGAIVIKLEYNLGSTFNGESIGGVYNNAIMFSPDKNNPFPE
jgi:hypothetical protein